MPDSATTAADRGAAVLDAERSRLTYLPRKLAFDMGDDVRDVEDSDELVEGLLTRSAMSMFYGDSNTGKTFLVLDLASAISLGEGWMCRRVQQGLVVYLAAESPRSVRMRALAYQRHHNVRLTRVAIVKSPIDLFNGEANTDAIISLVRDLESLHKAKVELIIGDTLARMIPGANENTGQDMGAVVSHIDRIREETGAHFALIHHCGKNKEQGMRGWSGLKAAVDTEIEVTVDRATGSRVLEITKQRDLGRSGERIGFRLHSVELGRNKWDKPITSCVVIPTDAPEKAAPARRTSDIAGALVELFSSRGSGMKKGEVVRHFNERYSSSAVYRVVKDMVEAGILRETAGVVGLVPKPYVDANQCG